MRTTLLILILTGGLLAADGARPAAAILSDLDSPDYQLRRRAVLAVEGRSEPELLEKVLAMARADDHPNIRGYCADVLGTFTDDRIYPLLVDMATTGRWPGPRSSAYVALGRLGRPEAYPVLIAGLSDENCRGYAAKGLGLLGDPRAWEPLLTVWRDNPRDGYLVDLAPLALLALDREKATALFLERFGEIGTGRYSLVQILREHPAPATREKMHGFLVDEDADAELRVAAVRVLGQVGDRQTVELLLPLLGKDPRYRLPIAMALAELGDVRAARPIAALLKKEQDPVARVTLIGALADLGDAHAVAVLMPLLDDVEYTRQPLEISSIWQFPYNLNVSAAALWAVLTLIDGAEPYNRNSLCSFPDPPSVDPHGKEQGRVKAWWTENHNDPRYRFE